MTIENPVMTNAEAMKLFLENEAVSMAYETVDAAVSAADEIFACVPPQLEAIGKLLSSVDDNVGLMDDRDYQQIGYMIRSMGKEVSDADDAKSKAETYFWLSDPSRYISRLLRLDSSETNQLRLLLDIVKERIYSRPPTSA